MSRTEAVVILLLGVIATALICCADIDVTTHQASQSGDSCCAQVDSLQQEIEVLRFITGQQKRVIECLKQGYDDCYGGV